MLNPRRPVISERIDDTIVECRISDRRLICLDNKGERKIVFYRNLDANTFANAENLEMLTIPCYILLWPELVLDFSNCPKLNTIIIDNSILHRPNTIVTFSGTSTGTNNTIDIRDLLNGGIINVSYSPNAGPLTINRSSFGLPNIIINVNSIIVSKNNTISISRFLNFRNITIVANGTKELFIDRSELNMEPVKVNLRLAENKRQMLDENTKIIGQLNDPATKEIDIYYIFEKTNRYHRVDYIQNCFIEGIAIIPREGKNDLKIRIIFGSKQQNDNKKFHDCCDDIKSRDYLDSDYNTGKHCMICHRPIRGNDYEEVYDCWIANHPKTHYICGDCKRKGCSVMF